MIHTWMFTDEQLPIELTKWRDYPEETVKLHGRHTRVKTIIAALEREQTKRQARRH